QVTERCPKKPSISSLREKPRPVRLPIISVKIMVTKDRETKYLAAFIKTVCGGVGRVPGKSQAERIGVRRKQEWKKRVVKLELTFNPNDVMEALEAASKDGLLCGPVRRSWVPKW